MMHADSTPHTTNDTLACLAWDRLNRAANDLNDPMRLMTMATIDARGFPQARYLLLRGACAEHACIWFHTDGGSRKAAELRAFPNVCAVAYDPVERVQLRLHGSASIHTDNQLADDHWQQTIASLRQVYGTAPSREQRLPFTDPRLEQLWHEATTDDIDRQRRSFAVVQVAINAIEWHQIRGAAQVNLEMLACDNWSPRRISPTGATPNLER